MKYLIQSTIETSNIDQNNMLKNGNYLSKLPSRFSVLLNDQEFSHILLVSDWSRRYLIECTSKWIDRKCSQAVYSGFWFRPIRNGVAKFSTNEIAFRCERSACYKTEQNGRRQVCHNPFWDSVTGPLYYVAIYWCPSDRIPYQSLVRDSGSWPKITDSLPGDVRDIITCACAKSRLSFNSIHVFVFRNGNHCTNRS